MPIPHKDAPSADELYAPVEWRTAGDFEDILYEKAHYRLPLGLTAGDYVDINAAGAYTATYSSVGFNGFSPLSVICVGENS